MAIIDALTMVNRAAALAGVPPFSSLTDDDPNGEPVQLLYDSATEFLLSVHPFSFALKWAELARVLNPPGLSGYAYEFILPADRTGLPKQYTDTITLEDRSYSRVMVNGNRVHTDVAQLWARYPFVPDPADWPATFRKAHTDFFASELALAIPNNAKLGDQLRRNAVGTSSENFRGGSLGIAIQHDAQHTPNRRLREGTNPLLGAWQGGAG